MEKKIEALMQSKIDYNKWSNAQIMKIIPSVVENKIVYSTNSDLAIHIYINSEMFPELTARTSDMLGKDQ